MTSTQHTHTRMTRQRRIILEELRNSRSHPTAEEIHDLVRKRLPRIGLATVYRNLERLTETGLIHRLDVGGGRRRFDGNVREQHYHARCLACGRLEDIPQAAVGPVDFPGDEIGGFTVTGHQLTFMGYCCDCRAETF